MHQKDKSFLQFKYGLGIGLCLYFANGIYAQELTPLPVDSTVVQSPVMTPDVQPSNEEGVAPREEDSDNEPVTETVAAPVEQENPVVEIFEPMDEPRDYLSEKVVVFAKSIDEFFGDERYFQEHNKSVVQLNLTETLAAGGSKTFAFEGQAKIDLPSAEKRFHFVFEANPEKKATAEIKKDQTETTKESAKPDQYSASLRYEQEQERWHFSSDAGAKFHFPLDPFVRARGSYEIPVWAWRLKTAETLFWFSSIGLGETTQVDMEYVISPPVLFRATSTATCYESPQLCDLRQDFSVFHTISERAAMLYQASTIGVNKPVMQETEHILLARYRYRLHKKWVFLEVSPQLHFPRTDEFKMNSLLLFRLEMLIGGV
jgi:hypothetical protein